MRLPWRRRRRPEEEEGLCICMSGAVNIYQVLVTETEERVKYSQSAIHHHRRSGRRMVVSIAHTHARTHKRTHTPTHTHVHPHMHNIVDLQTTKTGISEIREQTLHIVAVCVYAHWLMIDRCSDGRAKVTSKHLCKSPDPGRRLECCLPIYESTLLQSRSACNNNLQSVTRLSVCNRVVTVEAWRAAHT